MIFLLRGTIFLFYGKKEREFDATAVNGKESSKAVNGKESSKKK